MGGAAEPPPLVEIIGADLSLVTAFFNRVPLWISLSRAPYRQVSQCSWSLQISSPFQTEATLSSNHIPDPLLRSSMVGLASFLEEAAGEGHLTLPAAAEEGVEEEEAYRGCFKDNSRVD